jgi:hypothetical protein
MCNSKARCSTLFLYIYLLSEGLMRDLEKKDKSAFRTYIAPAVN